MKRIIYLLCTVVAGFLLAACGGPSAALQFTKANSELTTAWSHYFNGTDGEQGLTALGWVVGGQDSVTTEHVNQWVYRSSHLAKAIAHYDANLGPIAASSPYRGDIDAVIHAGSKLISDLDNLGGDAQQSCNLEGDDCVLTPLQSSDRSADWSTAQEAETSLYADFGMTNTGGGPYAEAT